MANTKTTFKSFSSLNWFRCDKGTFEGVKPIINKNKFTKYYLKAIIFLSIFVIYNIFLLSYIYNVMGLVPALLITGWFSCILIAVGIFIKLEKEDKDSKL